MCKRPLWLPPRGSNNYKSENYAPPLWGRLGGANHQMENNQQQPKKPLTVDEIDNIVKQLQYARFNMDKPQPMHIRIPQPGDDKLLPDFRSLDDGVFTGMPSLLARAFETLQHKHEKEVFLMGALGVYSAMMPHVQGDYFGFPLGTNMYCFVVGRYGTGKGVLNLAKILGDAVHEYRRAKTKTARTEYGRKNEIYNSNKRLFDRGETTQMPEPPAAPPNLRLYIPANSSKSGIIKLVADNEGCGIIFETEGDTLTEMLKQDFGNFSDVLRKAFHHEGISLYRKTGEEEVEINHPYLSIVMSGTYDQLFKLIPQTENGLYSRFSFYILQGDHEFANPFDKARNDRKPVLEALSTRYLEIYKVLEARTQPLPFALTQAQEEKFWLLMKQRKAEIPDNISEHLEGMIHRAGVMFFRIAMILSILRRYDENNHNPECYRNNQTIVCGETDFELALEITVWLLQYSLKVYELLPGTKNEEKAESDELQYNSKKGDKDECCRLWREGKGVRAIARILFGGKKSATVSDWIKNHCKKCA